MRRPLLASALLLLPSCKSAPLQEIAPPPASASAPADPVAVASAAPLASAAPAASAAPEDPFFGPTRLPGTRPRETVRGAGGVLLGVPAGWETNNVYDAYDLAAPKGGEVQQAGAFYVALDEKVGARGTLDLAQVAQRAHTLRMVKTTWDPPFEARVGAPRLPRPDHPRPRPGAQRRRGREGGLRRGGGDPHAEADPLRGGMEEGAPRARREPPRHAARARALRIQAGARVRRGRAVSCSAAGRIRSDLRLALPRDRPPRSGSLRAR